MSIALDSCLKRREWVYCMRPKDFEISGCPMCGNPDPEWSEFRHHCWCPVCKIDFQPEYDGVFGGPIPVQVSELMGICFDQFNVKTGEIRRCGAVLDSMAAYVKHAKKEHGEPV